MGIVTCLMPATGAELTTGDPRHQTQVDKVNLTMVLMVIVVESSQVDIGAAA